MTDFTVRSLTEDDWATYRDARLEALRESPEAFVADLVTESGLPESEWRDRMARSHRMLAEEGAGRHLGVVSLREGTAEGDTHADLFGLWVTPPARGTGIATGLVRAAAVKAHEDGMTHLTYWVGTDNGRAVAFASGFGFRPTDNRRPMRVKSRDDGDEEIEMVLPLLADRT
ncbi:MAG: GNAT family N-acetyltransferase [Nostocoides sp.]